MKSKATIWILSVTVIILWGIIVGKLFFAAKDKSGSAPVHRKTAIQPKSEIDTLLINYKDPFLSDRQSAVIQPKVSKREAIPSGKSVAKPKEKVNMKYLGQIKSRRGVKHIVDINGTTHSLSKGNEAAGFILIVTSADSLVFEKNEQRYTIATTR